MPDDLNPYDSQKTNETAHKHSVLFQMENSPRNDTNPDDQLSIEARLVKCLHVWRDDPRAIIHDDRTVTQEISLLLEWYICACISYGPDNLGGWWSDGVIHLEMDEPTKDLFKLLGVTWIDCHGIAPFEIDVELDPRNDAYFTKTVFRIGMLDDHGNPKLCDRNLAAYRVLEMRPRSNRQWAMAAELTPPPQEPDC